MDDCARAWLTAWLEILAGTAAAIRLSRWRGLATTASRFFRAARGLRVAGVRARVPGPERPLRVGARRRAAACANSGRNRHDDTRRHDARDAGPYRSAAHCRRGHPADLHASGDAGKPCSGLPPRSRGSGIIVLTSLAGVAWTAVPFLRHLRCHRVSGTVPECLLVSCRLRAQSRSLHRVVPRPCASASPGLTSWRLHSGPNVQLGAVSAVFLGLA